MATFSIFSDFGKHQAPSFFVYEWRRVVRKEEEWNSSSQRAPGPGMRLTWEISDKGMTKITTVEQDVQAVALSVSISAELPPPQHTHTHTSREHSCGYPALPHPKVCERQLMQDLRSKGHAGSLITWLKGRRKGHEEARSRGCFGRVISVSSKG